MLRILQSQPAHRRAFTLLELLLVVGIIAVIAGIVIIAINPSKQLRSAQNVKRSSESNQLEKALTQFVIDNGKLPDSPTKYPAAAADAVPICVQNPSVTSACVDVSTLVSTYIAAIPKDPQEPCNGVTGYATYQDKMGPHVIQKRDTDTTSCPVAITAGSISNGMATLSGDLDLGGSSLLINAGGSLNLNGHRVLNGTVTNNGTIVAQGGEQMQSVSMGGANAGAWTIVGTSDGSTIDPTILSGKSITNLTIAPTVAGTVVRPSSSLSVSGQLTIGDTAILDTTIANSSFNGTVSNNGAIILGDNAVHFASYDNQNGQTIFAGTSLPELAYHDLTIDGANAWMTSDRTVTGTLTINAGKKLTVTSGTLTAKGDVNVQGTLTGAGTIDLGQGGNTINVQDGGTIAGTSGTHLNILSQLKQWFLKNFGSTALSNLNLTNATAPIPTGCANCTLTGGGGGFDLQATVTALVCVPATALTESTSVTCTATITPSNVTGNVTFKDGAAVLCANVSLSANSAACVQTFVAGNHSMTAIYNADGTHTASTSNAVALSVSGGTCSLSGVVYGNDGVTPMNGGTLDVTRNGSYDQSVTIGSQGAYTYVSSGGPCSSADVFGLTIAGDTTKSVAIVTPNTNATAAFSGVHLYGNVLSLYGENSGSVSLGNLFTAGFSGTPDADLTAIYTMSDAKTLTIPNNVTLRNALGTFNFSIASASIGIAKAFVNNGTLLPGSSSTVTFNGTASSLSGAGTSTFSTLKINNGDMLTCSTSLTVNYLNIAGTFTAASGTVTFGPLASSLSLTGNATFNNLTIPTGAGGISTVGSFSINGVLTIGSSNSFYASAGTVTFNAGSSFASGQATFGNLTIANGASVTASPIGIYGNLTNNGTFNSSQVTFRGTTSSFIGAGSTTFGALTINAGETVTTSANFTLQTSITNNGTFTAMAGLATFIGGATIVNNSTIDKLTFYNTTAVYNGSNWVNTTSDFSVAGAFSAGNTEFNAYSPSTVRFVAGSSIIGGTILFYNITIASGTNMTRAMSGTGFYQVSGRFTVETSATYNPTTGGVGFNQGSSIVNNGTLSFYAIGLSGGGGSVTTSSSFSIRYSARGNGAKLVASAPSTITLTDGAKIDNGGVSCSTSIISFYDLVTSGTVTSTGCFDVTHTFTNSGVFTATDGIVTFSGSAAQTIPSSVTYHDLKVNKSSQPASLAASTMVTGNLVVTSGTLAIGTRSISVSGDSTVNFGGIVTIDTPSAFGWTTTNLTINGGTVSCTGSPVITVNGTYTGGSFAGCPLPPP